MTRPNPIIDPNAGQYQVVVSFRLGPVPDGFDPTAFGDRVVDRVAFTAPPGTPIGDIDVAVREIGAGGEASEDEGRYDRPSALGNTDDIEHAHPVTDIQAEGNRL